MDPFNFRELPPPVNSMPGQWGYIADNPAPVWIDDRFNVFSWAKKLVPIVTIISALVAIVVKLVD